MASKILGEKIVEENLKDYVKRHGCAPAWPLTPETARELKKFLKNKKDAFEDAGNFTGVSTEILRDFISERLDIIGSHDRNGMPGVLIANMMVPAGSGCFDSSITELNPAALDALAAQAIDKGRNGR